ncbi:MAG: hypothetical protein AB8B80_03780 [Marinicellaceae bacterium]
MIYSTSSAEVTSIQQEVLDDYMAMKNMSSQQRKEYRDTKFTNKTPEQHKAYTQAFKQVRAILPSYLGLVNGQDPAKLNLDKTNKNRQATNTTTSNRLPGTSVQYDSGTVTGTAGITSQLLGNRFDSALNPAGTMCCFPVEGSGSITMATFNMVNTFFSSAVFSIYSNISGTMAAQVTSMALPGRNTGLNTVTIGLNATFNNYSNGSFIAGIWQFDPTMTALGVDSGTTGGQGFHAVSMNDGAAGSMITDLSSLNAVFRVQGNVATPVELMDFTIE